MTGSVQRLAALEALHLVRRRIQELLSPFILLLRLSAIHMIGRITLHDVESVADRIKIIIVIKIKWPSHLSSFARANLSAICDLYSNFFGSGA